MLGLRRIETIVPRRVAHDCCRKGLCRGHLAGYGGRHLGRVTAQHASDRHSEISKRMSPSPLSMRVLVKKPHATAAFGNCQEEEHEGG